jgi:hypothetical protein
VEALLKSQGLGILALQETRQTKNHLPLNFPGFTSFDRLAEKPGMGRSADRYLRGEILLVSDQHQAWKVNFGTTCATWVKVTGLPVAGRKATVGVVKMPPKCKATARKELKRKLKQVSALSPGQPLIILGDFNVGRTKLLKLLRKWEIELEPLLVRGPGTTSKV